MAEQAELFRILDDVAGSTGGQAPGARIEGEAAASIEGLIGFSFKDSSGNVILPALTAAGRLPVETTPQGAVIHDSAVSTPGALNTDVDVVTLTLTASETYEVRFMQAGSFGPCIWAVEQTDDATVTDRINFVTGPGDFNHSDTPDCIQVVAGASGTQELKLVGQQIRGALTDMHGTLCVQQIS